MNAFEKTAALYDTAFSAPTTDKVANVYEIYKQAGLLMKEPSVTQPGLMGNLARSGAGLGMGTRAQNNEYAEAQKSGKISRMGFLKKEGEVEIYKLAGFDKEALSFAPVGKAIASGAKAIGHQVGRVGGAMQRTAFQASKGVPTAGQSMLHSAGQGVRNLGKGIAANPGTAAGVAGVGLAGMGTAGMAGRMTAPRQQ
jgi:hypothetical protein